jgi:glutaredoxin
VAILGTLLNAFLIAADARRSGVEVVCFLDSNKSRWGKPFCGRKVRTPRWLRRHEAEVDAVILSSEQSRDEALVSMLRAHLPGGSQLPILSWKSLAE